MSNQDVFPQNAPEDSDAAQHAFEFADARKRIPRCRGNRLLPLHRGLRPYREVSEVALAGRPYRLVTYLCPYSRAVLSYRLAPAG